MASNNKIIAKFRAIHNYMNKKLMKRSNFINLHFIKKE